jgi:polar amino acid transport system substrate-binding protein
VPPAWTFALVVALSATAASPAIAQAQPSSAPAAASKRALIYGGNDSFPPYEYLDAQGEPAGFNVALVRALAREAGVSVAFGLGPWRETLSALERGRVDFVTIAETDARVRRYGFLIQTWTLQHSVMFRPGRPTYPRGLEELAAESIATEPRALMDELLRQLPEIRRPVLIPATNQVHALRLVVDGEASGAAGNSLALRYTARRLGVRDLVEVPVKSFAYHLATQKGREADFAWLESALGRLRTTGEFERLVEQHLALPAARETSPIVLYLLAASGMVAVLWLGTVAWSRALGRQVRRQTVALERSLGERQQAAAALARTTEMLATIGRIQSRFIAQESDRRPFDEMLDELLAFTGSRSGFIG